MRSAKERLHDALRKGHPSCDAEPDYTRALKVLAEEIGGCSARLGDLEDEVEALKESEYDYDAIAGLTRRLEERIDENTLRLDETDEELDERLRSIRSEVSRLADSHNKLASLVTELESRLEDVEVGIDLQDRLLSDLRGQLADVEQKVDDTDAVLGDVLTELELEEEQWAPLRLGTGDSWGGWHEDEQKANPPAREAGERADGFVIELPVDASALVPLIYKALDEDSIQETHLQTRTRSRETRAFLNYRGMDFYVYPELKVEPAARSPDYPQRQKAASIKQKLWDHRLELVAEDESIEEGEDLPHAPHENLAEDVRAVFPNADIAVRQSDEQPGLDFEIGGVSYYVHPGRSVEQKVDGWKLERTWSAWLVERMLKFLEQRVSKQ